MTYKQIPEMTFGNTPAAMYLVRELNTLQNPTFLRSCGKRISATMKQVAELCYSYEYGFTSAKTLANSLRLMREEVSNDFCHTTDTFVDRLRRNVQIGAIKRGIRLATVARKAERIMEVAHRQWPYEVWNTVNGVTVKRVMFYDAPSMTSICAGEIITRDDIEVPVTKKFNIKDTDFVTPELLHARSDRRCARQGKPHTKL